MDIPKPRPPKVRLEDTVNKPKPQAKKSPGVKKGKKPFELDPHLKDRPFKDNSALSELRNNLSKDENK